MRAKLVSTSEELLVIEARSFFRDELWVPSGYMAHCEPAFFAALIDETPSLLPLLGTDLLHLGVATEPWRDRRDNSFRIAIGRFFLICVLYNRSHVVPRSRKIDVYPCKKYKHMSVCFPTWLSQTISALPSVPVYVMTSKRVLLFNEKERSDRWRTSGYAFSAL